METIKKQSTVFMKTERRSYPRFNPEGLQATIITEHAPYEAPNITGEVIDISCTGIKIKLNTPIATNIDGKIKIQLILPRTGIPLNISGVIKHQHASLEYGLHYENSLSADLLDDFLFECVKIPRPE